MKPIEIEMIPVSADRISVSLNYNLPGSIPMIRRWQIEKATLDEICGSVSEVVGSSLSGRPVSGAAEVQRPDDGMLDSFENAGRTFFEAIFRDQCDRLRSTTRTGDIFFLFKVDRTLAYLPFEILHDGEKFLSQHFAFGRVVYSESPAHAGRASELTGNRALILGDPSEDPVIRDDVEREVDSLRDLFRKSGQYATTIAMGREVSERMILSLLPETALLHFTGHGCETAEGTAGLGLYSGKVLAHEAFRGIQHPPTVAFFNTCSTASHETWRSPLGIMETLISRGTRACIAPLWDVASGAATSVALSFYTHLLSGETFGEALRRARVEAVEAGDRADRTWAAYALYGDPASVLTPEPTRVAGLGAGRIALRAFFAAIIGLLLILAPKAIDRDPPDAVAPIPVGYVILESEPADARIFLDGEEVGLTPTAIEVSVGKHQVAVMKKGYRRWQVSIDVKESPETVVRAVLQEIDQ